ncbi:MAG: hypothetical protein AB1797_13360 [bacterium]
MKNSWWFVFSLVLGLCLSPGCGDGDKNPEASDATPPVISEIGVSQEEDTVKVKWLTDELATSQVQYGTSAKTGFLTEEDKDLVTKHEVTIDSLEKGVTYYLKARSRDADNNLATSKEEVVALSQSSDTTPSVISEVSISTGERNIEIEWVTDEPATSQVRYGPTGEDGLWSEEDERLVINHKVVVARPAKGGFYNFELRSKDSKGNLTSQNYVERIPAGTGSISGTITPISSEAIVTAVQKGKEIKSDRIDSEDGSYRIEGLEGGVYDLVVSTHRYYENSSLRGITVIAFEDSPDHNVTLKEEKPLGSISGRITPASAKVFITASRGSLRDGSDWADEDGNYKIEDLMKGTYILVAEADGFSPGLIWAVEVTAGKDTGGQDITLKPLSTVGSISGVITPPLAMARVHVLQKGEEITVELTNDDGSYHIWNLKEGLYDLEVTSAYGYYSDTSMVNIEVVAGEESPDHNVTLTLIPTGSISGKITPLFPGKDIWFTLKGEFGSSFSANPDSEYRINPEDGSYVIGEVKEGTYDLVIEADGYYDYLIEDIVVIAGQDSSGHDVQLVPEPEVLKGSISGTITPASTKAKVSAWKDGKLEASTTIDPNDGSYKIDLPVGIYDLEVTAEKGYLRDTSLKEIEVISNKNSTNHNIILIKTLLPSGSNILYEADMMIRNFDLSKGEIVYKKEDFCVWEESNQAIIVVFDYGSDEGIIDLGNVSLTEVTLVPSEGYSKELPIVEGNTYAIKTHQGYYGLIYVAHLYFKEIYPQKSYPVIHFDWCYQPDGTRNFSW